MKILSSTDQAIDSINIGAVGILATDTVYGLVASAHNVAAVSRLYVLKQRENKPGTLIAASIEQLVELGIMRRYISPVEPYWPNPLSVVVPAPESLHYLHQGKGSLAVRIPADDVLLALLQKTGPLLTSSANQPGMPTATTLQEAQAYFGDSVDYYLDGGDLYGRASSTIIRVVDDEIEVLREGAVTIKESGELSL